MQQLTKEQTYDNIFWNVIHQLDGGVDEFLDLVFGFLRRRTGKMI